MPARPATRGRHTTQKEVLGMMKKSLMCAAIAGVFAAPAFAQTSNVVLYGRANVGIDTYRGSGATNANESYKSRTRVFDSSSRIGVRGSEDLGNGLRAVFQIESGVNMDTGSQASQSGAANGSSGFLGSRPSFAGLEGRFGRVLWGRQDVYWGNGTIAQTGANYISTDLGWGTGNNTGLVNVGVARQSNVMSYTTPQLGPVNFSLYWSPDTTPGTPFVNNESATGGQNTNAKLMAGTGRFAMGPITAQVDYVQKETRSDFGTLNGSVPKNTGLKGGLGFAYMPGAQIAIVVTRAQTDNAQLPGTAAPNVNADLKQTSWVLNWEHIFGNVQLLAQYGQMGKVSGCGTGATVVNGTTTSSWCDNSKSKGWLASVRYLMSKRTAVYAVYTETRNEANAFADYNGGSFTSVQAASTFNARGFDPRIIGVGVQHNF
jgi:predicted porin